ncbi:MAG: COX15/CtaA family protein [Hyphomonadaceae bacterium]
MSEPASNPLIPAKGAGLVRIWLLVVAAMVYGMILVGGATRLTDSGLSITEWKPLLGAIPPMNERDWADAFANYQAKTAQFHQMNPNMDLGGFKAIYWWEWAHRELGRTIGVVFALPLLAFWLTGRTTRKLMPHLLVLFALGGLQGLIGWWMVASGVNTELVTVAPYRLMTHFCLALLIICYCFWLWMELGGKARPPAPDAARLWARGLLAVAAVQMALGALVAGLDAGRGYTDWPMMAGRIVPEAMWALDPFWRNFLENEATTQFMHRMTAYLLLIAALVAAVRFREAKGAGFVLFAGLVGWQAVLGVLTLVNAAPLDLSLTHQALGTVVLLGAVRLVWRTSVRSETVGEGASAPA